jgi:hypothetical protein
LDEVELEVKKLGMETGNKIEGLSSRMSMRLNDVGTGMRVLDAIVDLRIKVANMEMESKFDGLKRDIQERDIQFWKLLWKGISWGS